MLWGWGIAVILLVVVTLFVINFFKLYEGAKAKAKACTKNERTIHLENPQDCDKTFCDKKDNNKRYKCDFSIDYPQYISNNGKCPKPLIEGDYGYCYNQEKEVKQSTEFDEYCNNDFGDFKCDQTQHLYKADRNGRCPGPKNDPVNALSAMEDGFCRKPTWQPVVNCTTNYRVLGAGEEIRDFLCDDNHYSPHSGQCPDGFAITDDPDRCKYVGERQSMQYNTKVGTQNFKKQLTYEQELANATKKNKK